MIALPLETIGFTLAAIEIFNSQLARRIEINLLGFQKINYYFALGEYSGEIREAIKKDEINLFSVVFIFFLITCGYLYFIDIEYVFSISFILTLLVTLLLIFFVNPTIKFLSRVLDGKAIGGLGLALSSSGIVIEAIQVWVIPQKIYLMFVIIVAVIITWICIRKL